MKIISIAVLAALAVSAAVFAKDDPRIERIRSLYQEARTIETAEAYHPVHTAEFNTIMPATGNQTTKVTFLFTSTQAYPERDPYAMSYRLHKVNVKYNVAANSGYLVEYLYDEKERPVFYYSKEEREYYAANNRMISATNERRYYFNGGVLITAIVNVTDEDGKTSKYTAAASFRQDDLAKSRTALSNAEEYLKFFRQMVRLERLK